MMKPVLAATAAFLCAAPAFADQVIGLPADPGKGNCIPFNCFIGEYQQVYTASAFSGPITIHDLEFYNTQFNSGTTSMSSGNWSIALSTTSADWNTLSTNLAANIGADNTTVFSGNLFQPWAFGDTLHITLSTPFTYNPANGNLIMDVVSNVSVPGGVIYFDENTNNSIMGRIGNGFDNSGFGLVTGFSTTAAPEPASMALLAAGLFGLGFIRRKRAQ